MAELSLRRLRADATLVLLPRVLAAVTLLALTPMIVTQLGKPAYGVWVLVSAASGLVGLLDVGIAPAVSRVIAFSSARGDEAAVRSATATATLMALALGAVVLAAGWVLAPALAHVLDAPAALRHGTVWALRLAFGAFAVTLLCAVYEGVLIGHQRFRTLFAVRTAYVASFAGGAFAALQTGHGIAALALSQLCAMALALALALGACWRTVRPRERWPCDRASVRRLLRFGLPQQSSRIAYASAMHYERLLVGGLVGASAAAEYGAASAVVAALCSLLAQSTTVLIPAFARLHLRYPATLEEGFRRAAVSFVAVAAGAVGVVAATSAPLVTAWLGPGFTATPRFVELLSVGFLLWVAAHPGFALVQTLGRPGLEARGAGVVVLANALVTTALVALVGAAAVGIGTSVALALGALAFWRAAGVRVGFLRGRRPPASSALALAGALAALLVAVNDLLVPLSRMGRLGALGLAAGEGLAFAAAYLLGLGRLGYLPRPRAASLRLRWPGRAPAVAASDPDAA